MSTFRRVPFVELEKLVVDDLNNAFYYKDRDVANIYKDMFGVPADLYSSLKTNTRNGILGYGFNLEVVSALTCKLKTGRGFQISDETESATHSAYKFFELNSDLEITLDAAAVSRIDLIQIKHTYLSTTESVEILNPTTGAWEPSTEVKKQTPSIITDSSYMVKTNGDLTFPTPDTGYIAMWYIYLPAGTLTLDTDNFIDARRMLAPAPLSTMSSVLRGFSIRYYSDTHFTLDEGEAIINGHYVRGLNPRLSKTFALADILQYGETVTNLTVYYLYLCRPDKMFKRAAADLSRGAYYVLCASSSVYPNKGSLTPTSNLTVYINPSGDRNLTEVIPGFSGIAEPSDISAKAIYIGSVVTDSSGNIKKFYKCGRDVLFESDFPTIRSLATLTGPAGLTLPVGFDEICDQVKIHLITQIGAGAVDGQSEHVYVGEKTSIGGYWGQVDAITFKAHSQRIYGYGNGFIPTGNPYAFSSGAADVGITMTGYKDLV